jgi:GNAT superfamily N-acetyltransferase
VTLELVTFTEHPQLLEHPTRSALVDVWPEFALHDPVINAHIWKLSVQYPELQVFLYDRGADRLLAEANTVPVRWDGTIEVGGVDWAMLQRFEEGGSPTTLCAVQVMIAPEAQGRGFSRMLLQRMTELGAQHSLDALIAPVRPTLKHQYPLAPIERFIEWRREDGELLDPWLRTHERLGATILGVAAESMVVPATRSSWREWTGMDFPDDGAYVVPGALVPVEFRGDRGLYVEPNVWMRHPLP